MEETNDENERYLSKLGNKDHWDNTYNEEIKQFENNTELIGDIWFGKQVQKRIVEYLNKNFPVKNLKILDVGNGNGAFLFKCLKNNFTNLIGMDYSEKSVDLGNSIKDRKIQDGEERYKNIIFYQEDIKSFLFIVDNEQDKFDLIHDKGTFDAFLLNKNNSNIEYVDYIYYKLKKSGVFIITSCNHLKGDLIKFFIEDPELNKEKYKFSIKGEIPHKSFSFGGQVGQTVTTLIFSIEKF
jgi:SAM-dependent methyltransferase